MHGDYSDKSKIKVIKKRDQSYLEQDREAAGGGGAAVPEPAQEMNWLEESQEELKKQKENDKSLREKWFGSGMRK